MRNSYASATNLATANSRLARKLWAGQIKGREIQGLRELTNEFGLSIARGEIQFLDGKWYVTHAGLLRLARQNGCRGIRVQLLREFCDPTAHRWVFRATVYKTRGSKGFSGYGDAEPSNVSPLVRGAEMRVAETRAVNRALRKAYGIGLCSVEELGWSPVNTNHASKGGHVSAAQSQTISGNGQSRLRDRLCQLIRQYQLDPALVKGYAAHFCATETLREAPRELVEAFINNLADWAARDRAGLLCHLNSFAPTEEVKP